MSEERFDRIDEVLVRIEGRLDGVDKRLDGVDERLDGVDQRLDGVDQRLNGVDQRLDGLDKRFDQVDGRIDTLDQHMRVLHEDVIDRIKALAEHQLAAQAAMNRGFAELKDTIGRRLDPLEAAMRHLSKPRPARRRR